MQASLVRASNVAAGRASNDSFGYFPRPALCVRSPEALITVPAMDSVNSAKVRSELGADLVDLNSPPGLNREKTDRSRAFSVIFSTTRWLLRRAAR